MKIDGVKAAFLGIGILWGVFGCAIAMSYHKEPDNVGALVFCILIALVVALPSTYILLKQGLTYYILDEEGITEHCLSKSRTFLWRDCQFVKRIKVEAFRHANDVIICYRPGLPVEMSDREIYKYNWPRKDTMRISNCSDSIYQEFLIWCGGERDIRT